MIWFDLITLIQSCNNRQKRTRFLLLFNIGRSSYSLLYFVKCEEKKGENCMTTRWCFFVNMKQTNFKTYSQDTRNSQFKLRHQEKLVPGIHPRCEAPFLFTSSLNVGLLIIIGMPLAPKSQGKKQEMTMSCEGNCFVHHSTVRIL